MSKYTNQDLKDMAIKTLNSEADMSDCRGQIVIDFVANVSGMSYQAAKRAIIEFSAWEPKEGND